MKKHLTTNARTSGVYLRADPADLAILDGHDDRQRAELIAEHLARWKSSRAPGTLEVDRERLKSGVRHPAQIALANVRYLNWTCDRAS